MDRRDKNVMELFKTHFKEYYDLMVSTEHGYKNDKENYPNKWHLEGSIWNHTKMVHDVCVETYKDKLSDDEYFILEWMCLLHDVGKSICFKDNEEKERRNFTNHFNFSYYITLDMLLLSREVKNLLGLSDVDIKLIAQTVLNHHVRYENDEIFIDNTQVLNYLNYLNNCDLTGRISEDGSKLKTMKMGDLKVMDKKLPSITFLIGPPCSGKSSFLRYKDEQLPVLSRDSIIMEVSSEEDYNEAWKSVDQEAVNNLLDKRYNELIKDGKDFVIDMTNMSKKSRKRYHNKGFNSKAVVFEVGYKELMVRNEKRSEKENKFIPENVIYHMIKSLTVRYRDEFNNIEFVRA